MERDVILCVDDDLAVLDALRRTLRHEPYDVITMDRPAEALQNLWERPVSAVIADEHMPEVSGHELLRAVAARSPSTGRIMLTAYPQRLLIDWCRREGIQRFVSKPWSDSQLKQVIHEVLLERALAEGFLDIT